MRAIALALLLAIVPAKRTRRPEPPEKPRPTQPDKPPSGPLPGDKQA